MIIKKYRNGQTVERKPLEPQKKFKGAPTPKILKKGRPQTIKPVRIKKKSGGCGCGKKKR